MNTLLKNISLATTVSLAALALAGCQANGGQSGTDGFDNSNGSGVGTVGTDDGIDDSGNVEGDGSNTQTGFPNDGSVGGSILEDGVLIAGTGADKGFVCTNGLSTFNGARVEVAANGLVGAVVGTLLGLLSGDSLNSLLNSLDDDTLAIDGDLTTSAVVTQTAAGLAGGLNSLDVLFNLPENSIMNAGNFAVVAVSFPPSLLDLGLLSSLRVDTLLDEVEQETGAQIDSSGLSLLGLSTDQLVGGASYALLGYKTTADFDQVRLRLSSDFLSVDLGENLFIHEVCTGGNLVDPPAPVDV